MLFNDTSIFCFLGHTRHEMTSWSSFESVFTFLQERYSALANKEELWILLQENMGMEIMYSKLPNHGLHSSYEWLERCTAKQIPSLYILVIMMSFLSHVWGSVQHIFYLLTCQNLLDQGCPTSDHSGIFAWVTLCFFHYTDTNICPAVIRSVKDKLMTKIWTYKAQECLLKFYAL